MNNTLTILKTGPLSSIQDGGRFGFTHLGITQGGVADEYAYHWANTLLNNPFGSAVIEVTLGGFEAVFEQDTYIAITGAVSPILLDNVVTASWQTLKVKKGQHLIIPTPRDGLRHYIALPGGVAAPLHLASTATVTKECLGGLRRDGSILQARDVIQSRLHHLTLDHNLAVSPSYVPKLKHSSIVTLNVILGSQYQTFSKEALQRLFCSTFQVDKQSNKMGYQLKGQCISSPDRHLISEGISIGAIQIPPNGQPIIMLCERQTIGGYPKVGNIARMDIGKLAQLKPGAKVKFVKSNVDKCTEQYQAWMRFFENATLR
ncbi:biotin-dependent carboxyltransferase family protein [Vibrio ezurae]|uniref:Carboxyltransferase domain-containing protein n=1 Tax=Vibrio ezurae NBRC 102218 TaxID=1219080 RepID=U3B299_9VIBR|nr:biotin-dependent carboxyltransferase family protein [Vibrio ezurae]GAD80085.1 hypothetical protein VEZ01S_23_00370 [Vibrio ezurae NBRC 102218]